MPADPTPAESNSMDGDAITATVQLVDVYLWQARIEREKLEEPQEGPTLESQVAGHDVSDEGDEIRVLLNTKITHPFRDEARGVLDVLLMGVFRNTGDPFSDETASAYAQSSAVLLMWPYARAIVSQFGAMSQLSFPPLPTLDVLRAMSHLAGQASGEGQASGDAPGTT